MLLCKTPGVTRSELGLVDRLSTYCDSTIIMIIIIMILIIITIIIIMIIIVIMIIFLERISM